MEYLRQPAEQAKELRLYTEAMKASHPSDLDLLNNCLVLLFDDYNDNAKTLITICKIHGH